MGIKPGSLTWFASALPPHDLDKLPIAFWTLRSIINQEAYTGQNSIKVQSLKYKTNKPNLVKNKSYGFSQGETWDKGVPASLNTFFKFCDFNLFLFEETIIWTQNKWKLQSLHVPLTFYNRYRYAQYFLPFHKYISGRQRRRKHIYSSRGSVQHIQSIIHKNQA